MPTVIFVNAGEDGFEVLVRTRLAALPEVDANRVYICRQEAGRYFMRRSPQDPYKSMTAIESGQFLMPPVKALLDGEDPDSVAKSYKADIRDIKDDRQPTGMWLKPFLC